MFEHIQFRRQNLLQILLFLPLAAFIILRLVPGWDWQVWNTSKYVQLVYFYFMAFISFMALVAGVFVSAALQKSSAVRKMFTRLAFVTLASYSVWISITTPETLYKGIGDEPMRWALRLALFMSAVFFALAVVRWNKKWRQWLYNGRFLFWLLAAVPLGILIWEFYFNYNNFVQISQFDYVVQYPLTVVATALFLWAGRYSWLLAKQNQNELEKAIAVTLFLLAEAQISQAFGLWGHFSWLLHNAITLAALIVALFAFLHAFNSLRDLQPARYFAVLGSILIVGLAILSGEMARLLSSDVNRRFIVGLTLIQGIISFVIMYIIVLSLDRLIKERTTALKREQKLRNELTRLIVHDLKNPLTIMTQGSSLLSRGRLGELTPDQKKLAERIEQAGDKTLNLINDILAVEKMEAGAVELRRTPLDLWKFLSESVAELQVLAQANQQVLTLRLSSRLPIIEADESLLRRVMDNIITNALKFSPENGRVAVSAMNDESHLMIEVADNGPGVSPTQRELIFEKFSQVHATERRGVGLGLTFCKMVIEAHQGTIVVEDSPLGGALFRISLPLQTNLLLTKQKGPPHKKKRFRLKPSLYTSTFRRL
jgi:signal transduction histidine kinase